jgi:mono/diheme cytochrome c family protein
MKPTIAYAAAALAALLALAPAVTPADEDQVELKAGPGKELVEASCIMCHSLDYIQMNSPIFDRKGWEGSVTKMIKVMGAPIPPEQAKEIVDYLEANYARK